MQKGKLIVFEGADGSGKTTQAELLLNYFKKQKIPAVYISFPRYKDSMWAAMVRRFLDGDFGEISDVDPYFVSTLYAGDRFSAANKIRKWIKEGKTVVCNRYVGSNIGHMAAKFKKPIERKKYIEWLEDLEYRENGIPKEDIVVLLQVDPVISRKLMKDRKLDIHEKDQKYQEEVYWVYDYFAKQKKNWVRVECTKDGKLLNPEQIHQKLINALRKKIDRKLGV